MSTTDEKIPLEDEDQILAFTQRERKKIVAHIFKNGVPDDPAVAKVGIAALDGMDKAALGRKRIKVDERTNDNAEHAAGMISKLLAAASGGRPYEVDTPDASRNAPTLPDDIPRPSLVDGETSVAAPQDNFNDFMARTMPVIKPESEQS